MTPASDCSAPSARRHRRQARLVAAVTALALVLTMESSCLRAQTAASADETEALEPGEVPYFDVVPDPLEGFNRGAWAINEALFRGVIYPLSFGYNVIAPKPIRTGISKAGHNLTYPVRLVNSCFQGKWHGAWEETKRFAVNSTVGLAGFFDPATQWKIGRSEEDFGQTLGRCGSGPGFYLMIPIIGPSNVRDVIGNVIDWPLDICFWIGRAYPDELWAQTIRAGFAGNDLSDNARGYKRQLDSLTDPYEALRVLYSLNRERLVIDYRPSHGGASNPDPAIRAVLFKPATPDFVDRAVTRYVLVPATGRKLPYSCWLQKRPAPVVYYIPGLGSHRLGQSVVAYADMLYRNGYSVVAFSNPFHQEFMAHASTVAVPGYGPADCDDIETILKLIRDDLQKRDGGKITGSYLTGVSHGGYFVLMIAAREATGKLAGLSFDRYVSVNPPVKLASALDRLDEMFNAPLAWAVEERRERMKDAIYKALYYANNGLDISGDIPLTREESQFLIGLVFRYTLMSVIIDSQRRQNLGVLEHDPKKFIRQESYREIRQISYADYMNRFVLPYLMKSGRGADAGALVDATDLRHHMQSLSNNTKIRVQICEDDFLLSSADVGWFRSTFRTNLTAYAVGGHLGNLHVPAVQEKLVRLFSEDTKRGRLPQ